LFIRGKLPNPIFGNIKRILKRDLIDFRIEMSISFIKNCVLLLGESFEIQFLAISYKDFKKGFTGIDFEIVFSLFFY